MEDRDLLRKEFEDRFGTFEPIQAGPASSPERLAEALMNGAVAEEIAALKRRLYRDLATYQGPESGREGRQLCLLAVESFEAHLRKKSALKTPPAALKGLNQYL